MVCSNCGQENPLTNRFCPTCGTPLPQRPLTAPGANSTLGFTRLPLEVPRGSATQPSSEFQPEPQERAGERLRVPLQEIAPEKPQMTGVKRPDAVTELESATDSRATTGAQPPSPDVDARSEVVPTAGSQGEPAVEPYPTLQQVLEDYKENPPRGLIEIDPSRRSLALEPDLVSTTAGAERSRDSQRATMGTEPAAPRGLGGSATALVDPVGERRSRFLELDQGHRANGSSGTSTIVGPSFLGLGDAPAMAARYPRHVATRSPWRPWLALVVLAAFGALGYLEWQAQVTQSNQGPLKVLKTEISRLQHLKPNRGSAAPTNASASKPDIRIEPQTTPPNSNPAAVDSSNSNAAANAAHAGDASAALPSPSEAAPNTSPSQEASDSIGSQPPAGANAPGAQQATPSDGPSNSDAEQPGDAAPAAAARNAKADKRGPSPKGNRPAPDDQEVITRKLVAGQGEMLKASTASDSAAAAAWLWKATAKGNPDAPVRLADMYIKGDGVPRSCDQAVVLLKSAASKPSARARNRLAALYATGTCVQRDRVQAYRWLNAALSADPTSDWALQNRDLIWRQMTASERTLAAKYQ